MAADVKGQVFTGARARFLINGIKIGFATSVSGSEEIQYDPVEVLDNIQVQEHVPIGYTCALSASRVRIIGRTLKSQGFFPQLGVNTEEHLTNILNAGDLACQIEDSQSGRIMANYEQVRCASNNWTINARGIVGNDMTFVCIRQRDESEV